MIIKFKIFENVNIDLPKLIGDNIVKIYAVENFIVYNNFYNLSSAWPDPIFPFHKDSFIFRIDSYKGEPLIEIDRQLKEKSLTIVNYSKGIKTIEEFIESILSMYSEPMDKYREYWGFRIKLTDLTAISEELTIDNYETWRDAKKYNI